jgi:hypothetical protein
MNALLEFLTHETGMDGLRRDRAGAGRNANESPPHPAGPVPLWLKARARAAGFRQQELERTHWKKVWRLMFED